MDVAADQMDEGCKRFRRWLLARTDLMWFLPTGSNFERPLLLLVFDLTDYDYLLFPADLCAIPPRETVPSYFGHEPKVLTICTNGVHAGFARLVDDDRPSDNQFYERPNIDRIEKSDDESIEKKMHGPAIMKTFKSLVDEKTAHILDRLLPNDFSWKDKIQINMDLVEAICCPYWPPEAAEWVTRKRDKGWPTKSDIDKVVNGGCHFVAKPHQSNPNDATQWRFSFSQAEFILIHSWTDVQMQIYHILRLVKSEVVKRCGGEDCTVLCSYFFKTLMLWACEEKPREFWEEINIETSIVELIANMIECLIDRRFPNYFMSCNNMIDYLSDDIDLSKEIEFLLHQGESCVRSLLNRTSMTCFDKTSVIFSNKFVLYFLLGVHFNNVIDPLDTNINPNNNRVSKYLTSSEELLSNIRELHFGIFTHVEMMRQRETCQSTNCESCLASIASKKLENAMEYNSFGNTEVSLSDSFFEMCRNLIKRQNSKHGCSRITENLVKSNVQDNSTSIDLFVQLMSAGWMKIIDHYLPTPLFVVAAAYRANFLFTGLMDYEAAVKACDEGRNWSRDDMPHLREYVISFCTLLPFIITSEWSAIFDEQIQVVFGFVSLYRKIFKEIRFGTYFHASEDEQNVVLRLCAKKFLDYVSCRCQRRLGYNNYNPLERPLMNGFKTNPLFTQTHFQEFSAVFLYAAAHIGLKSDLNSNENLSAKHAEYRYCFKRKELH